MKNLARMTWEDVYLDGFIDVEYEVFDEDSQRIHKVRKKYSDECWGRAGVDKNEKYIEENNMEYLRKLKSGEIKRIR